MLLTTAADTREEVASFDPLAAATEVRTMGSVVLRGVWSAERLAHLRGAIEEFTQRRRARVASGQMKPTERMYATHGVGGLGALLREGLVKPHDIAALFEGSAYHQLCRQYFGEDSFYVMLNRLGFRDHDPLRSDRSYIPYHQDSYTQDVRTTNVLNCWIPLDPGAGSISPGLEVVRNPCRPDFPRKDLGLRSENSAYDHITIDRDRVVEEYGECFLAPEFEVGDGMVFSENVIHRTYVTPTMTKPRMNFELRVFSPSGLAPGVTIADLIPNCYRVA